MSRNVDLALDAIDEGLELAAAPAYAEFGVPVSTAVCWRCDVSAPSTKVGLCAACHALMRDEKTTAPEPRDARSLLELILSASPDARRRYEEVTGPDSVVERITRAYMMRLLLYGFVTRDGLLADLGGDPTGTVDVVFESLRAVP